MSDVASLVPARHAATRLRPLLVFLLAFALVAPPTMTLAPEPARAGDHWAVPAAIGAGLLLGAVGAAIANSHRAAPPRYRPRPAQAVAPRPRYAAPRPAPVHHVAHVESRPVQKPERRHAPAHPAVVPAAAAAAAVAPVLSGPAAGPSHDAILPAAPQMAAVEPAITGPTGGSFH